MRLEGLHKTYTSEGGVENHVLRGVDLAVADGELVALMGSSGSGKTTLLNVIGALDQSYRGRVVIAGQDLKGLGDKALSRFRNQTVGYIFQQFHLLPHLPVVDNVAMPRWFDGGAKRHDGDERAEVKRVLERVGLAHKLDARPGHLSGGEKQRVAIARALYAKPKILLCDEPTGALDSETSEVVLDLIARLNADEGLTVVVVTHDPYVASRCRRTVRIVDGQIVSDAAASAPAPPSDAGGAA
ncbi:MAG: ABC transporter ATP-binding protein [Myxococcales bacterium]|nr:ABC transporter ATP-binding protein [Myxococcales bacterium]